MPRESQIMPKYTFPHEEVYVNDNSAGYDDEQEAIISYPYIAVFASSKGIDGQIIPVKNTKQYYSTFGKTNFKKYGQPHLMPEAILTQENAIVQCLRVMPDDATYGNSILSAWIKKDPDKKAFRIKFTVKSVTAESAVKGDYENITAILHDRDAINEYGRYLDGTDVGGVYTDDEGYTQYPLAVFTAPGRGVYGQNLRWIIERNIDMEVEYQLKAYDFKIIDTETTSTVASTQTGTIVSTPNLSDTLFINDIVEDAEVTDLGAFIDVNEESVEAIYKEYVAFCKEVMTADPSEVVLIPSIEQFDLFFGKEIKNNKVRVTPSQPYIKYTKELTEDIDTDADDYDADEYTTTSIIDMGSIIGVSFDGGSDGAFANSDETARQAAIDACYIKAFNGEYDKTILAPRRTPAVTLFDACYNMPVKMALAKMAMHRADALLYLDLQYMDAFNTFEIKSIEEDLLQLDDIAAEFDSYGDVWGISVNAQYYYIKEPSTGKRIPVTMTYYLASTDVDHLTTYGYSYQRTGDIATLTGHIKNSLKPSISESDKDLMQLLNDARFNYFEDEGNNTFTRSTQNMYVASNSDLLEEPNVRSLINLINNVKDDCRANRNAITSSTKQMEFRQYLLEKYGYTVGTEFSSLDIKYSSNRYEAQRSITHVYIAVTFPRRSKTTLIEVDVNKSAYEEATAEE